jgi:uncharacterized protein YjbI with pentapeptide repeats
MTQEQESSKQTSRGGLWVRAGFRGKSVWDWLELLIVPVVLAAAGLWFSVQQDARQRAIENQRTQDAALQSYIDQISELMIHDNLNGYLTKTELQKSPETLAAFAAAKARSATVLVKLDSHHNKSAIEFLMEGGLISMTEEDPISIFWNLNLAGADFRGINFDRVGLWNADLTGANLSQANLTYADFTDANLTDANLTDANLTGANLSDRTENTSDVTAGLPGQLTTTSFPDKVGANLTNADLTDANLTKANLTDAKLKGADLTSANLIHAVGITEEHLDEQAASLEGATMPNGQKYEDWIKHPRTHPSTARNTLPAGGAIPMGAYVTAEFKPAFYFEVGEGWQALVPEAADLIAMGFGPETEYFYDREVLYFINPSVVYDPSNPRTKLPAPENTAEWISWFQNHPNLDTSKPVPVTVGGASGEAIEVTGINAPGTFRDLYRQFCGAQPCVPLMLASTGNFIGPYAGTKYQFVIVDVGGETVISIIGAPADNFSEFLPRGQKILDTVEWKGE